MFRIILLHLVMSATAAVRKVSHVPSSNPTLSSRLIVAGHWIQVCPTNDDPAFDNKPRIKRTTGIPRSMLKVVEKPTALINDGTVDDTKQPSGVMVNADGDWVIAEPDKAAWEQYQAKAKQSAAAQEKATFGNKKLQDKGLECSIDKRLFVDPTRTPCCKTTYCHECITNALLDDDLQCPSCGKEGVLIDDLVPDTEIMAKIRSYEEEEVGALSQNLRKEKKSSVIIRENSSQGIADRQNSKSPDNGNSPSSTSSKSENNRKRRADTDLENNRAAPGPSGLGSSTATLSTTAQLTGTSTTSSRPTSTSKGPAFPPELAFLSQPPFTNANMMPGMNAMTFLSANPYMDMAMSMSPLMGFNPAMVNPMMMPNAFSMGGAGNQWNGINGMFPQQDIRMYGGGNFQQGMMPNGQTPVGHGYSGGNSGNFGGRGTNNFTNQQRTNFGSHRQGAEDSAYFRQPVNPHRHQGRRNAPRPTDYREI